MPVVEINQLSLRYAETRIHVAARRARLVADLAQHGQRTPVLVHPESEQFVLVDGYARVEALRELGQDLVEALVLEVSAADALLVAHRLQSARRRSALEEAWLLRTLIDEHGLEPQAIASRLSRSASWVSRRLGLIKVLPANVQDAVRRGAVCPQAAMRSLVPLARANAAQCSQLVAALAGTQPSVRELDQLYREWRRADAATRQRIVAHPQLFFRAVQVASRDQHRTPEAIQALHELCRQCRHSAGLMDDTTLDDLNRLRASWATVCRAFDALRARVEDLYA
jgi:ParB family chromosome partitioning protein